VSSSSYLTNMGVARVGTGRGWGVFAVGDIPAGATVAIFGGDVVDRAELDTFPPDRRSRSIQVEEDLYLAGPYAPEPADRLNHACGPTCALSGAALLVAIRQISRGEELTYDYATSDGSDYDEFACRCAGPVCRAALPGPRDGRRLDAARGADRPARPVLPVPATPHRRPRHACRRPTAVQS